MQLKVGDKVVIQPLSDSQKEDYEFGWDYDMDDYIGETATIDEIGDDRGYTLDCDGHTFVWSDIHLQPVHDYRYKLF